MNVASNAALQVVGFCIASLLATGVLVLAGLNERNAAPDGLAHVPYTMKEPR
jgi:hypothetical protein